MAKPLTRISRVLVVGRVITSTFGLLLALALAGCEGPPPRSGVPVGGTAIAPSATGDGPAETAETQPPADPDANAGVAAEPGQPSPPSPGPQAPATASEPSDSLAASVRDIAPATGPAPTPAPAAPRKPAIDDDPDRLMGLGFQPFGRQLDGLATGEDRLDDVGREKGEWQDPADIALIDAMTVSEITDRLNFAAPDLGPRPRHRDGIMPASAQFHPGSPRRQHSCPAIRYSVSRRSITPTSIFER